MSLEKRLPGHSYHTLSGQWKTMGKLFASMAVPLTINRVTTALFNSLENLLIPQKLQAFGYSASDALSIFGILTGMTMSIILFPSVLTNFLFRPFTSTLSRTDHQCTQPRHRLSTNETKKVTTTSYVVVVTFRFVFVFTFNVTFRFTFRVFGFTVPGNGTGTGNGYVSFTLPKVTGPFGPGYLIFNFVVRTSPSVGRVPSLVESF